MLSWPLCPPYDGPNLDSSATLGRNWAVSKSKVKARFQVSYNSLQLLSIIRGFDLKEKSSKKAPVSRSLLVDFPCLPRSPPTRDNTRRQETMPEHPDESTPRPPAAADRFHSQGYQTVDTATKEVLRLAEEEEGREVCMDLDCLLPLKRPGRSTSGACMWFIARVCYWSCIFVVLTLLAGIGFLAITPMFWRGEVGMHIDGEPYIESAVDAAMYADMAFEEANRIFDDKRKWHTLEHHPDLHIESIQITQGPYASSNCLLTRMNLSLTDIDASQLPRPSSQRHSISRRIMEFLMTTEGYKLIDPDSNPDLFNRWIETSSVYGMDVAPPSGRTRGSLQFGLRTREAKGGGVILEVEYWMDPFQDYGFFGNWMNCWMILQGFAHRLKKKFSKSGHSSECPCGTCQLHCRNPPPYD
ncbi:hypothetical protein AAMO2058_001267800 [Amorphochlora amoebiformis]